MPDEERPNTDQDDVEGHVNAPQRPGDDDRDDVEGHVNAPQRPGDDEDDVEGHSLHS
jgi:hypothetical protein